MSKSHFKSYFTRALKTLSEMFFFRSLERISGNKSSTVITRDLSSQT